jgi:ABC-type dipeptide/oligopeptide/nickel transport system ATPase component
MTLRGGTKMQIIAIIGSCGSGKSFLANELRQTMTLLCHRFVIIDDPKSYLDIKKIIEDNPDADGFFLCDPFLCEPPVREKAIKKLEKDFGVTPEFIFFENDEEACRRNIERRIQNGDDRKVWGSLRRFSKSYQIPSDTKTIPIWKGELSG